MPNDIADPRTGELSPGVPALVGMENASLAVQLAMAELNQDVITARSFPRSIAKVARAINELVMLDEMTAKECVYAVPRDGKTIRGPSIRLAEIIASSWGNCHCASRVVHVDKIEKYVESEGVFHDLETGLKRTARTRKNISKRDGGLYSQDMIMTAGNAAASIAMREAILKGVPKAVWRQAFDHAENVIRGDVTTLVERRADAMKVLAGIGVVPERVFAALGVAGPEEIGVDELADLFAMYTGVKNGDSNVDDVFPPIKKGEDGKPVKSNKIGDRLEALADGDKGKDKPAKDKPTEQAASTTTTDESQSARPRNHAQTSTSADSPSSKPSEEGDKAASGKQEPTPSQQPDAVQSQGEQVDDDPVAAARRAGAEARHKNMNRKAIPAKFRETDEVKDAWLLGFDTGNAEREPGEDDE